MFNNFVKKLKINLLYLKNKFLFFIKLINLKFVFNVIFWYICLDCLINEELNNFFLCSFLTNLLLFVNPFNSFIFLSIYFLISLKDKIILFIKFFINFRINKKTKIILDSNNYNNLFLVAMYYSYNKVSFKINFTYIFNWFITFIKFNFINNFFFIKYIFNNIILIFSPISWYTIFKRHSIFGFYRISRQRWVELKTEEVNFIKY